MAVEPTRGSPPDPSTLTTEQLRHEIAQLNKLIESRLDGYDRANSILAENVNRVPTLLDREILRITQLFEEKFASAKNEITGLALSMTTRFEERDVRGRASEAAASTAIAAALSALKEMIALQNTANSAAISKSEVGTTKEIDNIKLILLNAAKTTDDKMAALNARVDRGEGVTVGGSDVRTERRLDTGAIVGLVVGAAVIMGVIVSIVALALRH